MNLSEVKPPADFDSPDSPGNIKLRDFKPVSIFNTASTIITRACYPVIDVHSHAWQPDIDISEWVRRMDEANIEKSIVLTFETGLGFDNVNSQYSAFSNRFDLWCGFDYTGYDSRGSQWTDRSIAELERCFRIGAKGVGELGDKGVGEYYSRPVAGYNMHLDDKRLTPLFKKCGELRMPVSVHVADPIWMYLPIDASNDGMMNAYNWRIDLNKKGLINYQQLMVTFENAVRLNPSTIFIACHLANYSHDLQVLGKMLDNYPNLYADISSRLKEVGTVPRYAAAFFSKYQDRLFFGSDVGYDPGKSLASATDLYNTSFRILESADDHIYDHSFSNYHWPLYGLDLPDSVLKKIYRDNYLRLIQS